MKALWCCALLLTGCATLGFDSLPPETFDNMTPADARAYGVYVKDGTPQTGKIVSSNFGLTHTIERECLGHRAITMVWHGCAKAAEFDHPVAISLNRVYQIWYTDSRCIAYHEAAHALWETPLHTVAYNIRAMQGDIDAACPQRGNQ